MIKLSFQNHFRETVLYLWFQTYNNTLLFASWSNRKNGSCKVLNTHHRYLVQSPEERRKKSHHYYLINFILILFYTISNFVYFCDSYKTWNAWLHFINNFCIFPRNSQNITKSHIILFRFENITRYFWTFAEIRLTNRKSYTYM